MSTIDPFLNLVMMALSGAFGAGVIWTALRLTMKQYKLDFDKSCQENRDAHDEIKRRQATLRGELNGGKSIFMPRDEFLDKYTLCGEFKHATIEALASIKSRNIQKDQNWIELKWLLIKLAEKQQIEIPDSFGR